MTKTKIHTMYDDLAAAHSERPRVHREGIEEPSVKTKTQSFPLPPRPNNGSLILPRRLVPRSLGEGGSLRQRQVHWFIIGAAILIILNIIIWGIAIMG